MTGTISVPVGTSPSGRRSYSREYRIEFLQQWDQCVDFGSKSRLLRANKVDNATARAWVAARDRGDMEASMVKASKKSRDHAINVTRSELVKLRAENERLRKKVAQAEAAQEILGKAFGLLEAVNQSPNEDPIQIPPALMTLDQYKQWLSGHHVAGGTEESGSPQ
ncbi:MAG: hypothetical protein EKK60_07225 [Gordonia sp. (in: high G+C Gram-positive bacteria)]|nr:MAG: hypothetical protein EKK60_07225 [Gordonia sp. (in: high G+C Gram-positive bacteria)]